MTATAHTGSNADLLAAVAKLYLAKGSNVADITYGLGVFWNKINCRPIQLYVSDLFTIPPKQGKLFPDRQLVKADFCHLPYRDQVMDVVVFDPPYTHNPGNHMTDARYRLAATAKGKYHRDIMTLYRDGITESMRVTKPGGRIWIKCKDEIESGLQCWSHVEIYQIAMALGLYAKDLFVLVPTARTSMKRWLNQYHARKNHSFLWIMEKVG